MFPKKLDIKPKANCDEFTINIPSSVENLALPDPALLQYYIDQENRVVWLEGDVDETCVEIVKQIMKWNADDKGIERDARKPIRLCIFSNGGGIGCEQCPCGYY